MTEIIETPFSRRRFLEGTGALVVAISVPLATAKTATGATKAAQAIGPAVVPANALDSWIAVQGNGRVTVYTGKVDLGQGLSTSQMQIAAEELDVTLDTIDLVQGDTWLTVDQGFTAGSQSLKTQWATGLRRAAAEARAALVNMAATKLGVPASDLTVAGGVVSSTKDPSKSISYAALIGNQKFNLNQTGRVQPKAVANHTIVGRSVRRRDIAPKLDGTFTYVQDVKVPGMLHGRPVRPNGIDAKLVAIEGFPKGSKPKSLVRVIAKNNYVGVVAEREEDAILGAASLKVKWDTPDTLPAQDAFFSWLRNAPVDTRRVLVNTGDVDKAMAGAKTVVSQTYTYPHQAHASMGTSAAVADVRDNEATVWSCCQGVYQLRAALATLLGMPAQNVHVIYVEGSGCYGLNNADAVALDAAFLSQQVKRPVRVQLTREQEVAWENYGNAYVTELKAGLDEAGNIVAWDMQGFSTNRGGRPGPPANMAPGMLLGFPENKPAASPPASPPLGVDSSNATSSYVDVKDAEGTVKNARIVVNNVGGRLFTGPLRSPARIQYTTANEIFMDELALAVGQDPIAYRLKHLKDQRLIDVLAGVRDLAGWQPRKFPFLGKKNGGRTAYGRGVAACQYESTDGYVATIAEVEVDTVTGKVKVTKVFNTQDLGIVINPEGVIHQAEGCAVQGVSRALYEEVRFDTKGVKSRDWETYPVFRFTDMPKLQMSVINRPDQPALGAGELLITAVVAAVGNAIFDATGARIRTVPFTPARVKAALKAL